MASKKKNIEPTTKPSKKELKGEFSLFNVLENYLELRLSKLFYLLLTLSVLTGLILFDMRVSVGGDDSTYIQRAFDFLKTGAFPFEQGPLYPLLLTPFVGMFGINLFVLKIISFVCINLAFIITYKALKGRIPNTALILILAFIALNPFYQYFASVTYTEAFFLLMQSLAIYVSLLLIDRSQVHRLNIKLDWKLLLLVGLLYLLVSLTKTVAIICTLPLYIYFILNKKWDYMFGSFLAFIGLKVIYEIGIRAAFGAPGMGQFQSMFLVDLYKPQLGYENVEGMLNRFMSNANTFISARFFSIIYLRDFNENYIVYLPWLTYLVFALIAFFTYLAYRKNKFVFFLSLYTLSLVGAVFFGIQAKNTQYRLVIIIVPYLLLLLMFGCYQLSKKFVVLQLFFIGIFGYIVFACFYNAGAKSARNFPVLKENIKGNRYAGFTPDWVNYLKCSEWCGDSLPSNEGVIARKHSMSFIYGNGRTFTPIYQVPTIDDADSMIAFVKSFNCKYVIMAQLRANPAKKDGQIVNTINVIMARIHEKYPNKFNMVHREGNDEAAEVYEMLF